MSYSRDYLEQYLSDASYYIERLIEDIENQEDYMFDFLDDSYANVEDAYDLLCDIRDWDDGNKYNYYTKYIKILKKCMDDLYNIDEDNPDIDTEKLVEMLKDVMEKVDGIPTGDFDEYDYNGYKEENEGEVWND